MRRDERLDEGRWGGLRARWRDTPLDAVLKGALLLYCVVEIIRAAAGVVGQALALLRWGWS